MFTSYHQPERASSDLYFKRISNNNNQSGLVVDAQDTASIEKQNKHTTNVNNFYRLWAPTFIA